MTLTELPPFIEEDHRRHFLTLNRQIDGWAAAYVDFETMIAIIACNDCASLEEAAIRLTFALERYNKRGPQLQDH